MPPSPSRPGSSARLAAELFGRRGETLAAWYLRLKGYRILATRLKTPVGEIDLIARRLGTTVFVEVKSRARRGAELEAFAAVNHQRLVRAAEYHISRNPELATSSLRFDVIFLAPMTWPRHVMNAFQG